MACSTRSVTSYNIEDVCPINPSFDRRKLPLLREVIGLVRFHVDKNFLTYDKAILETAKTLHLHWISRNVYPIAQRTIQKKLTKSVDEFRQLSRTTEDKKGPTWIKRFEVFSDSCDKLFDVFCDNIPSRNEQEKKYGIPMLKEDFLFLQSMRSDRKYSCEKRSDSAWHKQHELDKSKNEKRVQRQSSSVNDTISSFSIETESTSLTKDDCDSKDYEYQPNVPVRTTPPKDKGTKRRSRTFAS